MKHQTVAQKKSHPFALWILKTLLLVLGITALIPGFELMLDPSGKSIGFPEGYLAGSPFNTYFIPGLLLTVFIGLLSLATWYALWKKPNSRFLQRINPFTGRHWAWTAALVSGTGLIVWILVEVALVPYFFLQIILLVWGAFIVVLCYAPAVKMFYNLPAQK